MIHGDGFSCEFFTPIEVSRLQTVNLAFLEKGKTADYESSKFYANNAALLTRELMSVVDAAGSGCARLTELEVSDNGMIEGLIHIDPYDYRKCIGTRNHIKALFGEIIGDHGVVKIFEEGFGGPGAMKVRMHVDYRAGRRLVPIDVVMHNNWTF